MRNKQKLERRKERAGKNNMGSRIFFDLFFEGFETLSKVII